MSRDGCGALRAARRDAMLPFPASKRGPKETTTMPKLRHIAIAAEDPYATAEFHKQAFDFVEVRRTQPKIEKGFVSMPDRAAHHD